MTAPTAAVPAVLNPLAHPDAVDDWADYEARNRRAAMEYRTRPFREIRRESERHLYRVAS